MEELWPRPNTNLDINSRIANDDRTLPPSASDRPWVTAMMISSLDGAVAIDGLSGGLGGPEDRTRFIAARRSADAIIVGATTAAVEDYQPTSAPIAVLSRSLALDPWARLFSDRDRQPILYTTEAAARTRGSTFDGIAEVVALGDSVAPSGVLADLHRRGIRTTVLEGGPTINGLFLADDLIDEALLTYSPLAVGGSAARIVAGAPLAEPRRFRIDRVAYADDLLFVRYLRQRP